MSDTLRDEQAFDSVCPYCSRKHDAVSGVGEADTPKPGNISICINCGEIAIFADDMTCRKIEDVELFKLMVSPSWQKLDVAITQIKKRGLLNETDNN